MSMDRCIVVTRAADAEALQSVRERLRALCDFYGPLGDPRLTEATVEPALSIVAVIDMPGLGMDFSGVCAFGAKPPGRLNSHSPFMSADDEALRAYEGPGLAVAADESRARLVSACGPPAMLYRASGDRVTAWSSHAIAASYVATGTAEVDGDVIPELIAAQFVGGSKTTIKGVVALEPAMVIDISEREAVEATYWPLAERRRGVLPENALAHAETALMEGLPRRVEEFADPFCGLTGGLDSRVVAVAAKVTGLSLQTFTFDGVDQDDVAEAPGIAALLGLPHRQVETRWPEAEAQLRSARTEQRWSEGATHLALSQTAWPLEMDAWLTGSGGETGRAFYYDSQTPLDVPNPSPTQLAGYVTIGLQQRLVGATPAAIASLQKTVKDWVDGAAAIGSASGWALLDLVYAEQRLYRWLRGTAPRQAGIPIPALASVEMQRGLLALPLKAKLSDEFHRHFLARHGPQSLTPAESATHLRRRGVVRRSRSRLAMARPGLLRIRDRAARAEPPVTFLGPRRDPGIRSWLADEVLRSDLIRNSLGMGWCERARARLLAGDDHALVAALWAGAPVALELELAALRFLG